MDAFRLAGWKLGPKADELTRTAIIDLLMMLDYEPSHFEAQLLQQKLIAGHMRTAISIPAHRQFVRSGYLSEPLLAEAACHRLIDLQRTNPNIVLDTVNAHYRAGLLRAGGERDFIARLLLMEAFLRACGNEIRGWRLYSAGCTLREFLKCLFVSADVALESTPDNVTTSVLGSTLDQVLGDAIVRLTHFVQFSDTKMTSWLSVHAAALRGAAIVLPDDQGDVSVIIPLILRKEGAVCQHTVTWILVKIQRRDRLGKYALLACSESRIGLFPRVDEICNCCDKPLVGNIAVSNLPYLSLVLDFGFEQPIDSQIQMRSSFNTSAINKTSETKEITATLSTSCTECRHPRYSIYANGCSTTLYVNIKTNHFKYLQLLGQSDFVDGPSFGWLKEPRLTKGEDAPKEYFRAGKDIHRYHN